VAELAQQGQIEGCIAAYAVQAGRKIKAVNVGG
jgi:hypothetical protein